MKYRKISQHHTSATTVIQYTSINLDYVNTERHAI